MSKPRLKLSIDLAGCMYVQFTVLHLLEWTDPAMIDKGGILANSANFPVYISSIWGYNYTKLSYLKLGNTTHWMLYP